MNRRNVYMLIASVLLYLIEDVSTWQLSITPSHSHIRTGSDVTVLCHTDQPLAGCQFKVKRDRCDSGLIDLSRAPHSYDISHIDHVELPVRYAGAGLRRGECGAQLADMPEGVYIVGCRARAVEGGWKYRTMTLQVNNYDTLNLSVHPGQRVINPGFTLPILCHTGGPMTECRIETTASKYTIENDNLLNGECRIAIPRIPLENNGPLWCKVRRGNTHQEAAAMILIVAKSPAFPVLELSGTSTLHVGETLTANCTVRDSRPASNITWTLGDAVLRSDAKDDFAQPHWSWPWDLQTVRQQVAVVVGVEHEGVELKCTAYHAALKVTREASTVVRVLPRRIPLTTPGTTRTTTTSDDIYRPPLYPSTTAAPSSESGEHDEPPPPCGRPIQPAPMLVTSRHQQPAAILVRSRLVGGEEERPQGINRFPWSVIIFKIAHSGYKLICGGTLISTTVVISSAQCFFDERFRRLHNQTQYKVSVGKFHTSYDVTDPGEQRVDIADVQLNDRYVGRQGYYQYDIAVLRLAEAVRLTSSVNVACVDWSVLDEYDDSLPFAVGQKGLITGYGITESGSISEVLRYIELPWVTMATCLSAIPSEMHSFYTIDKFCAGYVNANKSACPGDSGSGLMFLNTTESSFYLGGISSVSFKPFASYAACYKDNYTGFTLFGKYVDWVKEVMDSWRGGVENV